MIAAAAHITNGRADEDAGVALSAVPSAGRSSCEVMPPLIADGESLVPTVCPLPDEPELELPVWPFSSLPLLVLRELPPLTFPWTTPTALPPVEEIEVLELDDPDADEPPALE